LSRTNPVWRRVLVLGGARSGKSSFAEHLATACGEPVLYVATATASDDEMRERIEGHRARRPPTWRTLEAYLDVAAQVAAVQHGARTVLVEDLTLLLSNLMFDAGLAASQTGTHGIGPAAGRAAGAEAMRHPAISESETRAQQQVDALLNLEANVILVSNEVGMGLVPPYPLGRVFRDALGRLNQYAAARVSEALLIVAGLPQRLK
jgi:adenosylcobinamide kinase / adenosylcobinamide-phosphate guanylyltransferase